MGSEDGDDLEKTFFGKDAKEEDDDMMKELFGEDDAAAKKDHGVAEKAVVLGHPGRAMSRLMALRIVYGKGVWIEYGMYCWCRSH